MRRLLITVLAILTVITSPAFAAGKTEHVVVLVWDGLRPDSVTESNTPTLFQLAHDGVFFQNHHAVYPSATEVNGIALATGVYPNRNGVMANREYRPATDPLTFTTIESVDAIRKGDELSGNHYLKLPTLAEILQGAKLRTAIAGTKPVAALFDRLHRDRIKLTDNSKSESPNTALDTETTRALIGSQWDAGVPAFSLLWLSDPDYSEHFTGLGSRASLRALKGSDDNLALVLQELDKRGLREKTDVFVVSDHGFSTISRCVDVAAELKKADFNAAREFKDPPSAGDVLVVGNGGSVLLYIIEHDKRVANRIIEFLQRQDWPGVIFTREKMTGTFTFDQARINTADAPDVVISMRWTNDKSDRGIAGMIISDVNPSDSKARRPGEGNHTTLSLSDMRATLVASGPDFRRGMVDQLPSGNADLAPTILHVLGVKPPKPTDDAPNAMDGRVLTETFPESPSRFPPIEVHTLEATREMGKSTWHQYLRVTEFAGAAYFDEGNGQATAK
jgi:arylsulfatase A-like enzyme